VKIIVTGGRHHTDDQLVWSMLSDIHRLTPITLLVEGGAPGADRAAQEWAKHTGVPFITVEADWDHYPGHAGRMRNCKMLREHPPEALVAFPGGKGTRHMVRICKAAGVPVLKSDGWPHNPLTIAQHLLLAQRANTIQGTL
jgi:hypothetical protein